MRPKVIAMDFYANLKIWIRSKGTLFWSLAFPVILIFLFGAIFSGMDDVEYSLYVQDLDDSDMSEVFIEVLKETGVLSIESVKDDINITSYIKDENIKRLIVIPEGFGEDIKKASFDTSVTVTVSFYLDPGEQQSNQVVKSIIFSIIQNMNMNISQGRDIIKLKEVSTMTDDFNFIDFFLPGIIGMTIMQSCIYGSIERNTKYRKDGILRKLLTMPITRAEWIFAKMLFMLFLSFISSALIILVGVFVWDMTINITPFMILIIIASSFLFSGIGMIVGRFVKEEETADTAGGAIGFPMMFLAGTFWPVDQLDPVMQGIAKVLPLYYINEGLRNAMIYMNEAETIRNSVIVIVFALVFFIAGLVLTKWHED